MNILETKTIDDRYLGLYRIELNPYWLADWSAQHTFLLIQICSWNTEK